MWSKATHIVSEPQRQLARVVSPGCLRVYLKQNVMLTETKRIRAETPRFRTWDTMGFDSFVKKSIYVWLELHKIRLILNNIILYELNVCQISFHYGLLNRTRLSADSSAGLKIWGSHHCEDIDTVTGKTCSPIHSTYCHVPMVYRFGPLGSHGNLFTKKKWISLSKPWFPTGFPIRKTTHARCFGPHLLRQPKLAPARSRWTGVLDGEPACPEVNSHFLGNLIWSFGEPHGENHRKMVA